jgi:hypothetical protein
LAISLKNDWHGFALGMNIPGVKPALAAGCVRFSLIDKGECGS